MAAKRKEPETAAAEEDPSDWIGAVASVFRMLGEMREREKREEEELREERELAAWVAATRAESYARFNMRLPTPEEEAAFARDHAHEIDLSVLRPEDYGESKRGVGNDGILRRLD
ncbi:uncharacterized protein [Oryza sativa Japonica Group]|jgi:hypothetical protein|uniref:Os06g0610000 protein n=3 Tax=Oryza sativa TaxID=4530 RepID=Q69XH6_ORYSJ|nr:uncharacterized protein LOC4341504 [Oryza sativa Japonica Group]KAB8103063.1 hypothetical protein EE612_035274 [Oryza sativa]EAZ37610.1 hypothetical protein OsJ_21945 [Oryza sativa Japonica Group]KAF2927517.1 hypothetical protein DAI22_06g211300 [Oryza sativa Japonica Group]BAD35481.1 unknown protein [Oryza sativa Japonica Group]BAF19964.1 Os06g0610000 [Oryza sativa Japonica Group]|eukprot:NP_001058050.1 Os06g0610000 [Oryza sativa Japonica Group]